MNAKKTRQGKIRELLRSEHIDTHECLAEALARQDIDVSQSTLSKDLRELGVVRVPRADGGFRYSLPETGSQLTHPGIFERELRDYVTQVDRAGNMTVIKTLSGHAQAVCEAIDRLQWPQVMGTLAGENTIFVVSRTAAEGRAVAQRVSGLAGQTA
jgi:transcriptional regulator of arginine metabolism